MSETETAAKPAEAADETEAATETETETEAATEAGAETETETEAETEAEAEAARAARKKRILKRSLIQTAIVLLLPALAFVGLAAYKARKVDLIVDNGNKFPIKLLVNGKELTTIPKLDHRIVKNLSGGKVKLVAVEQGPGGEDGRTFTMEGEINTALFAQRRATFVWNVNGATRHYNIIEKEYDGGDHRAKLTGQETFEQDLFQLPDDYLPQLNAGFPKARQVERGGKRKMFWTAAYVDQIRANRFAQGMAGSQKMSAKLKAGAEGN